MLINFENFNVILQATTSEPWSVIIYDSVDTCKSNPSTGQVSGFLVANLKL